MLNISTDSIGVTIQVQRSIGHLPHVSPPNLKPTDAQLNVMFHITVCVHLTLYPEFLQPDSGGFVTVDSNSHYKQGFDSVDYFYKKLGSLEPLRLFDQ